MASFNAFNIRLPDPNWGVNHAGDGHASNYVEGPGFASVKLESVQPTAVSVTNSGRVTSRTIVGHRWKIDITYNPMTREQFEPIFNFLMEKRGRLKPFEVVLPQYTATQDSASTFYRANINVEGGDIAAGAPFFKADQHSNATVWKYDSWGLFYI